MTPAMRKFSLGRRLSLGASLAMLAGASPAAAQYIGAAPPPPPPIAPGVILSPEDALGHNIRILAGRPRDYTALIGAGRAALELGDAQAAIGFFGRAEEAYPTSPAPKAGLASAMVQMDDPQSAIAYFSQATRLGATPATVALDRGMARDLLGDLSLAQADYKVAMAGPSADEARRRMALSMAIARNKQGALDTLQPLLQRRDPAALRTRAFVLALTGDRVAAAQAIASVMPGTSARFEPFFRFLPNLSVAEKAAAVHLGIFPEDAATRVAQAITPTLQPVASTTIAPPLAAPVKVATNAVTTPPLSSAPRPSASGSRPSFNLPSATLSAAPTAKQPAPPVIAPPSEPEAVPADAAPADSSPEPVSVSTSSAFKVGEASPVGADGRLSGIDKLLATIAEAPPPAPNPKVEETPDLKAKPTRDDKAAAKKAADKKLAEKKARDEKAAADKKARDAAAALGVPGANWVQLAGGSNRDRLEHEYARIKAKKSALFAGRSGYTTEGKDYFRLLTGPFKSADDAHDFVNKLDKAGIDSFSWTRTPAQIKIEKIGSQ